MKTIYAAIIIFLGSLFITPPVEANVMPEKAATTLDGGWKGVNKKSAKRFKTHRGVRRGKHTCLKKNGCKKHKVIKGKKTKCPIK